MTDVADRDRILPPGLVVEVEMFVDEQLNDAAKYDNREPLDESGVFSLHMLAARLYAAGWADGERAQSEKDRCRASRARSS